MIMPVLKKTFFQETTFGKEWQRFYGTCSRFRPQQLCEKPTRSF